MSRGRLGVRYTNTLLDLRQWTDGLVSPAVAVGAEEWYVRGFHMRRSGPADWSGRGSWCRAQ